MTVEAVAERLEVSISTVYDIIKSGRLRCHRHGKGRGTIRVTEAQLADYLRRSEWSGPPEPEPRRFKHVRLP